MNEKQAKEKCLIFTGFYSTHKDRIVKKVDEIKKLGFKAYVIIVPNKQYARGYSAYAEQNYRFRKIDKKESFNI